MRQDVHFFFIVGGMGARIRSCFDSYKNKSGWHRCSGKFCNGEIDKTHIHTHKKKTQWSRHVNVQHWPQNGPICTPKNDQKSASRYSKSTPNSSTHSHLLHTLKRRFHQLVNKTSFSPLCIFNVLLRRKMVLYFGSFVSVWPHSTR